MPPALEAWSLNHWTTREVPRSFSKNSFFYTILKGYTPFIVITKYWLYSMYCTLAFNLSYTKSLYVPLPHPYVSSPPLLTTSLFSVYLWVCFFLVCGVCVCVCVCVNIYIHNEVILCHKMKCCHLQQYGWTWKALCSVKKVRFSGTRF